MYMHVHACLLDCWKEFVIYRYMFQIMCVCVYVCMCVCVCVQG